MDHYGDMLIREHAEKMEKARGEKGIFYVNCSDCGKNMKIDRKNEDICIDCITNSIY